MGINNFNSLLRDICPHVFVPIPITQFCGKRVAIDGHNWMFINLSIAHKKNVNSTDVAVKDPDRGITIKYWLAAALDFLCTWLAYGVTPVFVFDGEHPVEKNPTKQKRRAEREAIINRLKEMREQVDKMDMLARDAKIVDELRKLMCQATYPSKDEVLLLKNLLEGIGIPCLQATGDAEQLCSMLCIEGKVEAVFSTDTDNFAYGCPLVLTEFTNALYNSENGERIHQVTSVSIKSVLEGLNMSFNRLLDLCILAGCDYNSSIPQIGITRAYELMKKYPSIDAFPRLPSNPDIIDHKACKCRLPDTNKGLPINYDVKLLNHVRCREMFKFRPSSELIVGPAELNIRNNLSETGRDLLSSLELSRYLSRLVPLYKNLPTPTNECIVKPPQITKLVILS